MTDQFSSKEVFNWDNLLSGDSKIVTKSVTLLLAQNVVRGTLMGKIKRALTTPTPYTYSGTGNGAISAIAMKSKTKIGNYKIECVTAVANGGVFKVLDPDGNRLDDATVGVAYSNNDLAFSIADGSTDFIVGDAFTIPILAGSGKYVKSLAAAVDGSNDPVAIIAEDKDATAEDKTVVVYESGEFNENKITFGAGHTKDSVRDALRLLSIYLKSAVAA